MNRAQRRAAKKRGEHIKAPATYNMSEDVLKHLTQEAYKQGRDHNLDDTLVEATMHCIAISLKVLHEQYGYGPKRLERFANSWLQEYNEGEMSIQEIEHWCWEYGGFTFKTT